MGLFNVQSTQQYEYLYRCAMLSESHWLMGYLVDYYPCISHTRDINSDYHTTWDTPVPINIVFENDPRAILKKMNWLTDDQEQTPYVVYISNIVYPKFKAMVNKYKNQGLNLKQIFNRMYNPDGSPSEENDFYIPVVPHSKIVVPYNLMVRGESKFTISQVQGDSINPFIWICKLAVYHEQVDLKPDTPRVDNKISNKPEDAVSGKVYLTNNTNSDADDKVYKSMIPDITLPPTDKPKTARYIEAKEGDMSKTKHSGMFDPSIHNVVTPTSTCQVNTDDRFELDPMSYLKKNKVYKPAK